MVQVTGEQALGYVESLSNWGRWGAEDRLGTLNLVTAASTRAAAGLVRRSADRPVQTVRAVRDQADRGPR